MVLPAPWSWQAPRVAEPLSLGQLGRVLSRYWLLIIVTGDLGAAATVRNESDDSAALEHSGTGKQSVHQ